MAARVLVVDDLLPNVRLLEAKLETEYYDVQTALNGKDALDLIAKESPDIILLDVMMPEMDGFEVCRRIKADVKTADIPVVMVTALSDINDRVEGLNAGADDFLTKPINDLALFARIRSLVRLKGMTDELKLRDQTGEELGFDEVAFKQIKDTTGASVLIVDDDQGQSHQISDKLESIGMRVAVEEHAKDAVKRTEAEEFDLIIVSSELTSDDGLHLCNHFRSQEKTKATPLLIIIADDNMDLLVKGLDMGINDYLVNPIDSNELVARANIQIRRKRYQDALKETRQENLSMAITDKLTKVYNRHYLDKHLNRLVVSSLEKRKPLALMMIDIDHFKSVNDTHGHLAGDQVLQQMPKRILQSVRATDMVARFGGEEFAIILPDTTLSQAAEVAERIRKRVDQIEFDIPNNKLHCTISIGVSMIMPGDTPEKLIGRADKALYHVKSTGRNKVAVFYDPPEQ